MWPYRLTDEGGGVAESDTDTTVPGGHTMFEYALHSLRHDELVARAEHERLAREANRLRRAARREAAARTTEAESHSHRRRRFARAA
ncbi:hypothetical protein GCM10010261_44590 [Streptomyces pilosus]|nr:hypothetical protein GCM10010261_44590 [Streptomyces pilosus]